MLVHLARSMLRRRQPPRGFSASAASAAASASAGLDVDPKTLRSEMAAALADNELDDDGIDPKTGQPSFPYVPGLEASPKIVRKNGVDLLHDPLFNKV